jgi:hypothetical protein
VLAGVQVQSTPALVLSLVTLAVRLVVALGTRDVGAPVKEMATAAGALIVIEAVERALPLAVEVAVIETVPAADGAVYVVAAPLAVCVGLKLPQVAAGEQDQSTPALEESPETVSVIVAVAPVFSAAGLPLMAPVIVGGGGVVVLLEPPPQPISSPVAKTKAADTLILMNMKDHPLVWRSIAARCDFEGRATIDAGFLTVPKVRRRADLKNTEGAVSGMRG